MDILINLFIFCLILFLYIHVYYNIKTSNYLEVYEIDNPSKEKFEELCNLKQPLVINNFPIIDNTFNLEYLNTNYNSFDVKIRNKENIELFLPITLSKAIELFDKDASNSYISEGNKDFLEETTIEKIFNTNDLLLRPYNISNIEYDLIFGSLNSYTPFRYNLNCRNILYLNNGSVEITLAPPKNYKYLYVKNYYENLEFISSIDINNVADIHKNDFDKVKLLRIILKENSLMQIPPYWFYSIKIIEKNTLIFSFKYRTYMNTVSILPQLFIKFLQENNIKINTTKIIK